MRITQWGEYGVHCAVFIAQRAQEGSGTVSAAEISEAQGIDLQYTQQILQRLRRKGIVESVRGPQGGYRLAREAKDINLEDLLVAAEGATFEVICEAKPLSTERCAPNATCNLRQIWHQLRDHINAFLHKISLADLLASAERPDAPIQISKQRGKNAEKPST